MDKVVLTESEHKEIDLLMEEINAKGGMSTEKLIIRLNAVPFNEFMNNMSERMYPSL